MGTSEQPSFGEVSSEFLAYENSFRGHIRYQVARRNLEPFVIGSPMQIIDVQGGTGPDTAWLAGLGHQVMLLEADEIQLRHAAKRAHQLPPSSRVRIIPEQGDLEDMEGYTEAFGLALCHGVAMYKPDPHDYISQVTELVKPGGIVSILEKGFSGSLKRAHYEGKSDKEIQKFRHTQRTVNSLGMDVYAFKAQELYDTLFNSGLEILHWAGVRMTFANANKPTSEFTEEELQAAVKQDYILGNSRVYRSHGQLLHFIARKPLPEEQPQVVE